MSRFVILYHEYSDDDCSGIKQNNLENVRENHWDLMLEDGPVLKTWEVLFKPSPGTTGTVRRLPDHRLKYLEYEGKVSGNRGKVSRIASGSIEWIRQEESLIEAILHGKELLRLELQSHQTQGRGGLKIHPTINHEEWWFLNVSAP